MSGTPNNGRPHKAPDPPVVIQPSPAPFTFQADLVMTGGQPMIQLRWFTPCGVTILFVTPDDARTIANIISDKAGGLVVPKPDLRGVKP